MLRPLSAIDHHDARQALSNNVLWGQTGKETELSPLNCFVTENVPRLRRYFDQLIDVPELSMRELQLNRYLNTLRAHEAQRFVHLCALGGGTTDAH